MYLMAHSWQGVALQGYVNFVFRDLVKFHENIGANDIILEYISIDLITNLGR